MRIHLGRLLASGGLPLLLSVGPAREARAAIPAAERAALIALYNSTNGAGWTDRTNWRNAGDTDFNDPGTECTWYGVTCSGDNVYWLHLSQNNLAGSLPPDIASFSELVYLEMWANQLTGPIPDGIGSLPRLEELRLFWNQLSGPVPPAIGGLSALRVLRLDGNQLNGSIPVELANLASLELLSLGNNQLSGPIPVQIQGLSELRDLDLSSNQLTGGIPVALASLASLESLALGQNPLAGSIPPELGGLINLQRLHLWDNQLTGSIPAEIGALKSLQLLWLSVNELSGDIPAEIWTLPALDTLWLDNNRLTGSIPASVGNLTHLAYLSLGRNQLTGSIPPELGTLADLAFIRLGENQLTGAIPAQLGSLTKLVFLELNDNQLTGSIPDGFASTELMLLHLQNNGLTGSIPPSLGNLTTMQSLIVASNQLGGPIPAELGNLKELTSLWLADNHLEGSIPSSLGSLSKLTSLYIGANRLSGSIPKELGGLSSLQSLGLQSNQLSGVIPPELANLTNLSDGWGVSLPWNGLHTSDPALAAFLTLKGGAWEGTQTVAPTGVSAGTSGTSSTLLSWTPIAYTGDGGGYRVHYGTTPGGPYPKFSGPTAGKEVASTIVSGLAPDTDYYFVVETVTEPHSYNQSTLVSGWSAEVFAHTASGPSVYYVLAVTKEGTGSGRVTSVPAGIDCGTDCDEAIIGDSVVTLTATPDQGSLFAGWSGGCTGTAPTCDVVVESADVAVTATFLLPPPTSYYTVPPCRAYDSRVPSLGGPAPLAAGSETNVMLVGGACGIPAGAAAVSFNVAVTQPSEAGHLRLYPQGVAKPNAAMLNYVAGQTRANNAIVPLSAMGELTVYVNQAGGTAHVVIDVNGYYAEGAGGDPR